MSTNVRTDLVGVIPAIISPMKESGDIDHSTLEKQTAYLSSAGVNGFFVGGTTAEGAYLTSEEKREIFQTVRSVASSDQFLCAAYIQPSTRAVLEEMAFLESSNPDFVVAVTPYYHAMSQDDIIAHYKIIAGECTAPLLLYNIPGNTHNVIGAEAVSALSEVENVVGIKDSTGDFIPFSRGLLGQNPEGFHWIQGADLLDAPSLMLGCDGLVTGLGNARIEPYIEMYHAAQIQDWDCVRRNQARINHLHKIIDICGNSVSAVKAAANLSGRGTTWLRQKSQSLSDVMMEEVAQILDEHDSQ